MDVGQHLRPVVRQLHEARVGLLEEGDVVVGVHLQDRRAAEVGGLGALEADGLQRLDQRRRAVGVLERIDDAPVHQLPARS